MLWQIIFSFTLLKFKKCELKLFLLHLFLILTMSAPDSRHWVPTEPFVTNMEAVSSLGMQEIHVQNVASESSRSVVHIYRVALFAVFILEKSPEAAWIWLLLCWNSSKYPAVQGGLSCLISVSHINSSLWIFNDAVSNYITELQY